MIQLNKGELSFPDVENADVDGALAYGGDLSEARLLLAYKSGIFPWFSGNVPVWYAPDPRFVLYPDELKVSKSMKVLLKREAFRVTMNQDFEAVIRACKSTKREGQQGTWITRHMEQAYIRLHKSGWAHSVEAWKGDRLVGGLYGIRMGAMFFGESMFSHESNASKYAFIRFVEQMAAEEIGLIDCQVYTPHLESLGARHIPRSSFMLMLEMLC
jgi:leucyl/phenylalanyl-tRNA--protein transferase